MARVEGPVVRQLNVVFATDWYSETGENLAVDARRRGPAAALRRRDAVAGVGAQVVPSGPGFATENNLRLFNSMLYAAERRLSLTSPYFVPDESLLYAVTTAAQRGVEVELFVSATADQFMVPHAQRSYYDALLDGRRADLALPRAVRAARQALHRRRHARGDRVQQHGHALLRPQLRGRPDADRGRGRRAAAARSRTPTGPVRPSSPSRSGASARWGAKYVDNVMRLTAALQ